MDERLENLLNSAKETAEQVGDLAIDAAYAVSKKAEGMVNCAKTKLKLADLKAEVNTQFRELGEMLYATHTGTPTASDALLEKMQQIDALKEQIAQLRHAPAAVCPICGGAVDDPENSYCKHCGSKL